MTDRATERERIAPVSGRIGFLYLEHAVIDVEGGAMRTVCAEGETTVPAGALACLMLGPGTSITQSAITLLARSGCLVLWTGEEGVRVYSAGTPGGASGRRLIEQARIMEADGSRLAAARRLYRLMLGEEPPQGRSIDQLRGFEGNFVRAEYARLAALHGVPWNGRDLKRGDAANRAISMATSTLYGATEAAILAVGLSPAIGIVHRGDDRSLVFDIADTVKFKTVVPLAFRVAADHGDKSDLSGTVRRQCRDLFVREQLLDRLVTTVEHVVFGHDLADCFGDKH